MGRFFKKQKGFTLIDMTSVVAIVLVVTLISLPVFIRVVNNLKAQSIIATLWALFEAQKSYRDAQTPTTYANTIEALVNGNYIQNPNRYNVTFVVASVTPDTFVIEAREGDRVFSSINQSGSLNPGGGGGGGGGMGEGGGGGQLSCPYLYVWNGFAFTKENDLNPGGDVETGIGEYTDFYLIMKKVVPQGDRYVFQIREELDEMSWMNAIRLYSIDHPAGVQVAPSPEGKIFTYREKALRGAVAASTQKGKDVVRLLNRVGKEFYQGSIGDQLILNFGKVEDLQNGVRLVMSTDPEDGGPMVIWTKSIYVYAKLGERKWSPVTIIHPHETWDRWVIDLTEIARKRQGEDLLVKLVLTKSHRIDFAMLDTSPVEKVMIKEIPPLSMHHTRTGDILKALEKGDEEVSEMVKGDRLTLEFKRTALGGEVRDFLISSTASYKPLTLPSEILSRREEPAILRALKRLLPLKGAELSPSAR